MIAFDTWYKLQAYGLSIHIKQKMAAMNPVGMGPKTSRQFNRVANDIIRFANGIYDYNGVDPVGEQWYVSYGTIRTNVIKPTPKLQPAQSPKFYPSHVSTPSPLIKKQRALRKASR